MVTSSITPRCRACWSVLESRPTPTTLLARPRERNARPTDPPISPTPTIATVSRWSNTLPSRSLSAHARKLELHQNLFYRLSNSKTRPIARIARNLEFGLPWGIEQLEGTHKPGTSGIPALML